MGFPRGRSLGEDSFVHNKLRKHLKAKLGKEWRQEKRKGESIKEGAVFGNVLTSAINYTSLFFSFSWLWEQELGLHLHSLFID